MSTPAERRVGRAIRKARRESNTPHHVTTAAHEANMREFDRAITHALHRHRKARR